LVAWRLLERTEERSYRIALSLRMIGSVSFESDVCSYALTVQRCLPVLDELSRATKSNVRLGTLRGTYVQLLQPSADRPVGRIHAESLLHSTIPAHAAASGKALLAFSPTAVVDRVIKAGLRAFTPHTITSPDILRQELTTTRLTQVASSRGEFEYGTAAIAMPIFYGRGRVELKPAASALAVTCRSLSRQLASELHANGNPSGDTGHSEPALQS
jgi:DNA-binding IclR family transcriptional regulator